MDFQTSTNSFETKKDKFPPYLSDNYFFTNFLITFQNYYCAKSMFLTFFSIFFFFFVLKDSKTLLYPNWTLLKSERILMYIPKLMFLKFF